MGEGTPREGISRRDLIKRSAVAGAIVWSAPLLETSTAWAQTPADCNECDGLTLYSKYAPGNANVTGNQCLAPCDPVVVISGGSAIGCGLFSVDDTVESGGKRARIIFSNQVRLIRTSIKGTSNCYVATCEDFFQQVNIYGNGVNPPCDDENQTGTDTHTPTDPPLFTFYDSWDDQASTGHECSTAPSSSGGCANEVRVVDYNTAGLSGNVPLNFVEIVMCLKGTSKLPPGCA